MRQEIDYSRFVDRYLDDVMSADEKTWFEKELEDDEDLQKEIQLHKSINKTLGRKDLIDLEKQLDNIYQETYQPWSKIIKVPVKSRKLIVYTSSIAATVALLIFGVMKIASVSTSTDELYASYYQPAEINMSFRTAEDIVDADLRSAMIFYENKDYRQAIMLFENILKADDSRIGLNLYSGISHMEIEEYAEANRNFEKIIDHKANAFIESAEWYLGLCYLMTEENEKAKDIFLGMSSREGYYRKEARKILRKMK